MKGRQFDTTGITGDVSIVYTLRNKELCRANSKYPLFSSTHEGYAVLREEVDEACDEIENIKFMMDVLWTHTKAKEIDKNLALTLINGIERDAVNAILELVQVTAMCEKYKKSLLEE